MGLVWVVVVVGLFFGLPMFYVYRIRGFRKFNTFGEYFRKGWPIFAPLNCMLYASTKPKGSKAVMDLADFPEMKLLSDNWETIRDEAMKLEAEFERIRTSNGVGSYDIGFRTFFKYGWSKFYLTWYGNYTHPSAQRLCPKTVALLKQIPYVNGAMLTLLKPRGHITKHFDPVACSLRYHLGLKTPNSEDCFIDVDGQKLVFGDGKAFLFDETYLHHVENNTDESRLILMCEVDRPVGLFGKVVNALYKVIAAQALVPNTEEDGAGLIYRIFASVSPMVQFGKRLKARNLVLYKLSKYAINLVLLVVVLAIIYGIVRLIGAIFGA